MASTWPAGLVSSENLQRDLDQVATITEPDAGLGITRLAMTPLEREAHALIAGRLRDIGMIVREDAFGNTIALLPGTDGDEPRPIIGTGSHLDSVSNGGRFDGIIGVVGAVEAARVIAERRERRPFDLVVVAWANEEGARFTQACNGSRAAVGQLSSDDLDRLVDADGISLRDAMLDCGLQPDKLEETRWDGEHWTGFIELHCEQGSVLESEGMEIGIVDSVSSSSRFSVEFTGIASHSGGTPMPLRHDAAMAAAEWMLRGETIAHKSDSELRITFGRIDISPNSVTTVPGRACVWVDVRDIDNTRMDATVEQLKELAQVIADQRECQADSTQLARVASTDFNTEVIKTIGESVRNSGLSGRKLFSGASHDAQIVSDIIPTGMIFVPSDSGISHAPDEHTSLEQIRVGAEVLAASLWSRGELGLLCE